MTKEFVIVIEETVAQNFEIEAENAEQAIEIAEKKHYKGEFVLEPGEVCFKQMAVIKPDNKATEWVEF